jgi:hypothetical protein
MRRHWPLFVLLAPLAGCEFIMSLLSTDTTINVSCAGDDTVVIDGKDICEEYEKFGKVDCDVGYRIKLDGVLVCPAP